MNYQNPGKESLEAQTQQQLGHASLSPPHSMPTPTTEPWTIMTMPWRFIPGMTNGNVMQFTAPSCTADAAQRKIALHQKRKSDIAPPMPAKQFITEEIITKHFNGLHISSNHIQSTSNSDGVYIPHCFTNLTYNDYKITAKELEEKLKNANRITMCEEIKKFHEGQSRTSFIPEALLSRMERPCTALVLWQPPPVLNLLQQKEKSDKVMTNVNDGKMFAVNDESIEDIDAADEIDDYIDNNNTCNMDFNNPKQDAMDEDL